MVAKSRAPEIDLHALKRKALIRFALAPVVLGLLFFLPAGSFNYWQAWLYILSLIIPMLFVLAYFLKHDPALLERRLRMKEKQAAQKKVILLGYPIYLAGFIIPGLDFRFNWSNVPFEAVIISNLIVILGYYLVFLVMKENSYLSRTVVVEKGQKLISTGPYAVVRHPMYTGVLLMFIFTPLALGSYLGLIPFMLTIPLIVYRLLDEERLLGKELRGYREYCNKVKYRLIPYVW